MKQKKFLTLDNIGNLYYLCILEDFETTPILFVCYDQNDNYYLCLCSEIRGRFHWTIALCDQLTISEMVKERITIYDAFQKSTDKLLYSVDYFDTESGHKCTCTRKEIEEIDPLDLPDEDLYSCVEEQTKKELLDAFYLRSCHSSNSYFCTYGEYTYSYSHVAHLKSQLQKCFQKITSNDMILEIDPLKKIDSYVMCYESSMSKNKMLLEENNVSFSRDTKNNTKSCATEDALAA